MGGRKRRGYEKVGKAKEEKKQLLIKFIYCIIIPVSQASTIYHHSPTISGWF